MVSLPLGLVWFASSSAQSGGYVADKARLHGPAPGGRYPPFFFAAFFLVVFFFAVAFDLPAALVLFFLALNALDQLSAYFPVLPLCRTVTSLSTHCVSDLSRKPVFKAVFACASRGTHSASPARTCFLPPVPLHSPCQPFHHPTRWRGVITATTPAPISRARQ